MRVVIADPGKWPELHQAGVAFRDHDRLAAYVTTLDGDRNRLLRALRRAPGPVGRYVERESRRRSLGPLGDRAVERGAALDLAVAGLIRLRGKSALSRALIDRRDAYFDAATSRRLPRDADLFLGQAGACRRSLVAARELGMRTVVNWNIQHWEVARAEVEVEREQNPAWATPELFTFTDFSAEQVEAWEAELASTDLVLTPSTAVTESFVDRGFPAERIVTLPYGVDLERYAPPGDRPPGERPQVLSIGEISQRKGISYLFAVARRLPSHDFHCVGWRVAPLPEEPPPNVSLHFSVPDIKPFLQRASAFLFPTLLDGFGLVVLEAMACGLPVVSTANAGARDVISAGEDGWVVPTRDVDAMSGRLEELAADPDRAARMAAAARRKAAEYPWSRFHAGLREAFDGSTARRAA